MTQDFATPPSSADQAPAAPAAPHVKQAPAGDHPPLEASGEVHKKHRTTGNKLFDLVAYPGIAFFAVLIASAKVLDYMVVGKGKASFDRGNERIAGWLGKLPGLGSQSPQQLHEAAHNTNKILISFGVGTLLMVPLKLLEDQRSKISRWFDKLLDSEPKNPGDYKDEPKQSWKSVLGGRAITFGSVLALGAVIGDKRTKQVEKAAGNFVAGAVRNVLPEASRDSFASKRTLGKARVGTRHYAFELFYTALCATLVYVLSRFIASSDDKKQAQHTAADSPASETAKPDAEQKQLLAGLASQPNEPDSPQPASQPLHRTAAPYGTRHDKPTDFRTKYAERKDQDVAMLV